MVIKNQTQKDQDPFLPLGEISCGTSGSHLIFLSFFLVSKTKHIKDFIGIIFLKQDDFQKIVSRYQSIAGLELVYLFWIMT